MLANPESNALQVAVVRGAGREHLVGQRIAIVEGIAGWVESHHESLILHGTSKSKAP